MSRCVSRLIALALWTGAACAVVVSAGAQSPFGGGVPVMPAPPDPAAVFRLQCGTCHTTETPAAPRQGPNLAGVLGRRAGMLSGFKYSAAFTKADFTWDEAHLDAWLTNPQAVLPGTTMVYRQTNPATRKTIIDWLKEQH